MHACRLCSFVSTSYLSVALFEDCFAYDNKSSDDSKKYKNQKTGTKIKPYFVRGWSLNEIFSQITTQRSTLSNELSTPSPPLQQQSVQCSCVDLHEFMLPN